MCVYRPAGSKKACPLQVNHETQTRHGELNIYTRIRRRIYLCVAHGKKKKRHLILLLLPAQALLPWELPSLELWLTNSDQQTKHEKHEKGLLESTPWLLFTHRHTHRRELLFFSPIKPESVLAGPQGRPSIITTQRNAFVRWIINKYPRRLQQRFNYTYTLLET